MARDEASRGGNERDAASNAEIVRNWSRSGKSATMSTFIAPSTPIDPFLVVECVNLDNGFCRHGNQAQKPRPADPGGALGASAYSPFFLRLRDQIRV